MSLAIVVTVRNERELLRTNLIYHHYLGVELALVYDGSSDDTLASILDLPFAHVRPNVELRDYYRRWAIVGDYDVARLLSRRRGRGRLRRRPVAVEVQLAQRFVEQLQARQLASA